MSIASTTTPPPSTAARGCAPCRMPRLAAPGVPATSRHRDLPAVVRPDLVPTLSGDLVDYANLDHAASTPAFERVARAVEPRPAPTPRSTAARAGSPA